MEATTTKRTRKGHMVRETAEAMAEGGVVNLHALAERVGLSASHVHTLCRDLRLSGWEFRVEGQQRKSGRKPGPKEGQVASLGLERADPAAIAELIEEAYRGMGDGRRERDDPRRIGEAPSSGIDHLATPPLKLTVGKIVREWKVRTGRARPRADRPAEARVQCSVRRQPARRADPMACVWRRNEAPGARS